MADPIKFTDGEGVKWTLRREHDDEEDDECVVVRDATPDDLARAGYVQADECNALRALEQHVRDQVISGFWFLELENLLKAVDEARK